MTQRITLLIVAGSAFGVAALALAWFITPRYEFYVSASDTPTRVFIMDKRNGAVDVFSLQVPNVVTLRYENGRVVRREIPVE